jgi:hypothetical protein
MMKELLIRSHLGLGDGLIINALVRHFAKDHDVTLLCKKHNQVRKEDGKFAFVHDDADRGFVIPQKRLPKKLNIVRPEPGATENIFAYWGLLEQAQELHMIDSSFAILADSLPDLKAKKMQIHLYTRANALPPSYRKDFEVLKS